ncbi:PP2C family protein-serine/threonine phosphatase [Streptomyces albipurpureus]|uniref:SpoIIE family protein phosphatase n=1 Tax=Streptomyces albipurpureus TaxID=2897419 RepID=A0ABT0UMF0_9ACTN|nr:GAF domain-containing SpoIIE family protein phosphatase [Streptomyces sp. CWNU-1]MCM2389802.1 SpoIIE family protein phosphatase [Streptomyces sp. CWNU-1]
MQPETEVTNCGTSAARWSEVLHELWSAADRAEDVTALAGRLYTVLAEFPGVLTVVGTRWHGGQLRYMRGLRTADSPPALLDTDQEGCAEAAARAPGSGTRVREHDTADLAAGWPEAELLRAVGAKRVVECVFALDAGDWASLVIGLVSAEPADPALSLRLRQASEVVATCNRRIVTQREHERRQVHDAFLAEASLQMDASLDVEETLQRVARLAVPAVAEGCLLHLRQGPRLVPVASAHIAADRQSWLADTASGDAWLTQVLRRSVEGEGGLILSGKALVGGPLGAKAAGVGTSVRVLSVNPLRARGRVLGTLTFLFHHEDASTQMPRFLADLANRAALAIDTSTLYEQRRQHVVSLQRHLLPAELPHSPGLVLSSAYEVADDSLDVGGDFYDAIPGPSGRIALLIGDVCGRGAEAAALTGLARHTLRTLLEDGSPGAHTLVRLNQALHRERARRFVTALVVTLVPEGDGFRAEVANAGHPPPLVRRASSRVERVECGGLLLGVQSSAAYTSVSVDLGPGDSLVLFTDGLTEARARDGRFFEDLLPGAVAREGAGDPRWLAGRLVHAGVDFRVSGEDDVAVLAAFVKEVR